MSSMNLVTGLVLVSLTLCAATSHVRLTTSYCPSLFSGRGSVVDVDPMTGNFSLVSADWVYPGSKGDGCPENQSPNVYVAGDGVVYLTFSTQFGYTVSVNSGSDGSVLHGVAPTSNTLAFDGFTSVAMNAGGDFIGITPMAGPKTSICSDGCFQYGSESWPTAFFSGAQFVPYKSAMTNVAFYHEAANVYYFQGSYPLSQAAACSSVASDECFVALNGTSGALLSTVASPTYTVYSFFHRQPVGSDMTVLAFVFGFEDECKHPYNDFAFASVNLQTGAAKLIACMDKSVSINTDPNVGSFSPDGKLFATGSGNSETGEVQIVVLDTATGAKVLDSSLPGLKAALKVSTGAPFINVWGVSWSQ